MVVWLCHARVGHRQGLYPETPSPATVGVFLCLAFAGATAGRDPKQVTARGFTLKHPHRQRWGFSLPGVCRGDRWSRPETGRRQGLYPADFSARPPPPPPSRLLLQFPCLSAAL